MYLSIYVSIYLSTYLSIYVSIYLRIYLSMYVAIYLRIYLSMYVAIIETHLFHKISSHLSLRDTFLGAVKGDSRIKVAKVQKRVVRILAGVSSRTSCRNLFKEFKILTIASLYILEVTCFIQKYCKSLEKNTQLHQHDTRRKLDIHVKMKNMETYKKSVINTGTKIYNKLPGFLKEIDDNRVFRKKLKTFLLLHSFYSVEEFFAS